MALLADIERPVTWSELKSRTSSIWTTSSCSMSESACGWVDVATGSSYGCERGPTRGLGARECGRRLEHGRITGSVALLTDVSGRREAETSLAGAEQRYRTLLEMSPIGMFHVSLTGELIYVNRKWCGTWGRSPLPGTTPTWESVMHPDDFEIAARMLRAGFETEADFEENFRLQTPDGEIRWVTVRSVPIEATDGMMRGASARWKT